MNPSPAQPQPRSETPLERFRRIRQTSLGLAAPLEVEDMVVQSTPTASPTRWHLAHTTCLNRLWFSSLTEARVVINQWLEEYNTVRPHGSLGGMNPEKFLQCWSEVNLNQQPETLTG